MVAHLHLPPGSDFAPDLDALTTQDLEGVLLCLEGASVLDLRWLHVHDDGAATNLLRLNGFDEDDPFDGERLLHLHREALRYLREQVHVGVRLPPEVARPSRIADLMRTASRTTAFPRTPMLAGAVLKLMHLVGHVEARALRRALPLADDDLERAVGRTMEDARQRLRARGINVVSFHGGHKARGATITKLLTRRDAAASILDRLRFRLVAGRRDELVPALAYLLREVVPFNHVLARESANNLIDVGLWLRDHPRLDGRRDAVARAALRVDLAPRRINRFSSDRFRMANFVVELPVRVDRLPSLADYPFRPQLGRVVHVATELQLVDRETDRRNDTGESSHDQYKRRQRAVAHRRLKWGLHSRRD